MSRLVRLAIVVCVVAAMYPTAADALTFRTIRDGNRNKILLVYDCGVLKDGQEEHCPDARSGFHESDPSSLRTAWRDAPFEEVWLLSGGGLVTAGLDMAKFFYETGQAVRVPGPARLRAVGEEWLVEQEPPFCISSCTVAFMGGQFRSIDEGASYQVHSSSAVRWDDTTKSRKTIDAVKAILERDGFVAVFGVFTKNARTTARALFTIFQDALWLPIKPRKAQDAEWRARESRFNRWEFEGRAGLPYSPQQEERDKALFALEGEAALQDIIMREERRAFLRAIAEMKGFVGDLGRRGDAALGMLEAMYDTSSILETNSMPRETMLKMGYLTEFVQ